MAFTAIHHPKIKNSPSANLWDQLQNLFKFYALFKQVGRLWIFF